VFRSKIDYSQSLASFFREVSKTWISIQDFSLVPLTDLLTYLKDNGVVLESNHLLSNMFNYSTLSRNESSVYVPPIHAKSVVLTHVFDNGQSGVRVVVEWAPELIDNEFITNFIQSFCSI